MKKQTTVQRQGGKGGAVSEQNFVIRDPEPDTDMELTVSVTPASDREALPLLESRQQKVIDSLDDRDTEAALIRIRAHRPEHINKEAPYGFQRGMAATTTCFSFGESKTGPTTTEYSWIVCSVNDRDIREFVKWASFYLFAGGWANDNGYETDQLTPDGTVILSNGSTIDSPYHLDDVIMKGVPSDFYDNY